MIKEELLEMDQELEKAENEFNWNSEGVWEYIEKLRITLMDLDSRVKKTQFNVDVISKLMQTWKNTPMFTRKVGNTIHTNFVLKYRTSRTRCTLGGIDGEIGRLGGDTLEAARFALPVLDGRYRCLTGDAKITVAGDLPCSKVIHAVGPAFGYSPTLADHADKLELLEAAYKNAMERARENDLKSVGFCILSAGIFRGGCPLKVVIQKGLESIAKNVYAGLETVVFCGFTPQEQGEIHDLAASLA